MQGLSCIDQRFEQSSMKQKKTKNKFTEVEDNIIKQFVQNYGAHTWGRVIPLLPGRTPRQVRERYVNYLSPNVNLNEWTKDEDELILKLVAQFGKKWAYISRSFNQRTDVSIKNRYFLLKRKEQKEIRNNLFPKLAKGKLEKFDQNQLQPKLSSPANNNQSSAYQNAEEESFQLPMNLDEGVIEEQSYHIDMFDSELNYPIYDDFTNEFDFQFFA